MFCLNLLMANFNRKEMSTLTYAQCINLHMNINSIIWKVFSVPQEWYTVTENDQYQKSIIRPILRLVQMLSGWLVVKGLHPYILSHTRTDTNL